ncbi:Fungal specific transcription factor domain [Rhizoctonia solani]|uniref:Fungal specific transcription factor domain n=1 Tax=Rhizoctonia solani TaxID=456999 RepID=A0A8H8P200_9AGAM|nr:Fungal specific transcription factor domain [Rhizoctonia solani]QRW23088.1 Fungal specific transcription factor domain [Rhizoctonia solani]
MEYAHTNQRRVQPTALTMHPSGTSAYYTQSDPQYITHADPSTWQQQQYYNNPSPQDSARATLSPPNAFNTQGYSSDYLTPSPRSSHPDSWSASSNQWVSPRESPIMASAAAPPAWNANAAEVTWNSGIGSFPPLLPGPKKTLDPRQASLAPTTSSSDQRSTSGASDNDTWAITTARGKRLRTDESQKLKTGACKNCKRLKMKCTFDPPGSATCQRCRGNGHDCIVEGRKPRKNSEPLEQLSALIDDKQEIIDGLLRIVSRPRTAENTGADTAEVWRWIERAARSLMPAQPSGEDPEVGNEEERLPPDPTPIGLLADLSLNDPEKEDGQTKGMSSSKSQTEEGDDVGVANAEYFRPGPMAHPDLRRIIVERQMVPEILTLKVIADDEVEHLFRIFHERIDAVIAIIDPVIHTVAGVKARCPFLFTVTSRYWIERPELYKVLMHYAKSAAATAITDGWKSLEVCQAYLLLSVYPQPAKSWAEDRGWLYLGCAIRLAMDLGLYKQASKTYINETHEREVLNRTRTWLICFNMDRALATRLGRPTTIPEDYIVRHSREWWRRSKYNGRLDVHLCYYTQLLRTVTRYFSLIYSDPESVSGFNESTEFGPITRAFDDEMEQFKQDAEHAYSTAPESRHPTCQYRLALMPLAVAYYRLVMYSFGLEHAHRSASEPGNMFLIRSVDTASEVLRITNEDLPIHEYHRYSPDGHWMWSVFAAAFLIKLAKPRSVQPPHLTMTETQRETSLVLVEKFIHTLECSAVDDRHSPALYARFLRRIMGKPINAIAEKDQQLQPADNNAVVQSPPARMLTPGPSDMGSAQDEDVLAAMYNLTGDFWDNALLPGTWGITSQIPRA